MTKTLYVPDYIANKKKKEKGELEKAYVSAEDRYLEPSKLSESALDK